MLSAIIEVNSTTVAKSCSPIRTSAVDGYGKDADASFIDCVAWNKAAELLAEYAPKGKQLHNPADCNENLREKDDIKRKVYSGVIDQFQLLSEQGGSNTAPAQNDMPSEN